MKDISKFDLESNLPLVTRPDCQREVMAGNIRIARGGLVVIAGPCTIESRDQVDEIAAAVKQAGADMLRGGAFKPLTFPYGDPLAQPDRGSESAQVSRKSVLPRGEILRTAEKRLSYLKAAGTKYRLPVVSEILYADTVPMMSPYVDMFQIGYRHMFNMDLIEALSKTDKPLLIKRHYGESLRSLLGVCEHFEARGKHNFAICERGVAVPHTHNIESRAVLDIQAIPAMNDYAPSVPVIADPSHSTFKRSYVAAMARAAIAAGADGILIDVHSAPDTAWVDPLQALDFAAFAKLVKELKAIRAAVN